MKTLSKYFAMLFCCICILNVSAQLNCNNIQATGNLSIIDNNYPFINNTYFIPYDSTFAGIFTGNLSGGGVLNYVVSYDSLLVNEYSVIDFNFNNGSFNTVLPICETFYLSAVYGEDNNFDGIVDEFAGDCSIAFTTYPIMFYVPVNFLFIDTAGTNCDEATANISYAFYGGISDCIDNDNCESTYIINNEPGFCTNTNYTYKDPFTGDSVLNLDISIDSLYFDFVDIDGSNYNYSFPFETFVLDVCPPPIVLPIELLSFTATANKNGNLINWESATEINSSFYSIFKSKTGENFKLLKHIEAVGNTNQKTSYQLLDDDLSNMEGKTYYQLSETDFNGTENILATIEVDRKTFVNTFSLENIEVIKANNTIKITYQTNTSSTIIDIYDINGNIVKQSNLINYAGLNQKYLELPNLASGIYIVKFNNANINNLPKFVW